MAADGLVQVAADGSGKSIDQSAITVPAGTVVIAADGSRTTLSADATYYRQRIVLGDPTDLHSIASVRGELDRGALLVDSPALAVLGRIAHALDEINLQLKLALEG